MPEGNRTLLYFVYIKYSCKVLTKGKNINDTNKRWAKNWHKRLKLRLQIILYGLLQFKLLNFTSAS